MNYSEPEWPEPEDERPSEEELADMLMGSIDARATDGCEPVEADGTCEHGYPAWTLYLGLI